MKYLDYEIPLPSGAPPSGALTVSLTDITPTNNTHAVSGDVAAGTPISAADTVRYTFDYVTAGTGTGSSVTISGAFGSAISVPDGTQVFNDTGIVLQAGATYGNFQYNHPQIPNFENSGTTDSGVAQEEGIVRKAEIRTEVLEAGTTVVLDQTDFSSYLQITYDNGTVDTNNATQQGSIISPAGYVSAWTDFFDEAGAVEQTLGFTQNGQTPASVATQFTNETLGTGGSVSGYGAWAVANTNWTVPRGEYRKNTHGWGGPNSGTIWFYINGVRTTYPNTYQTGGGGQADAEWKNFIEWAIITADPSLTPDGTIVTQNVMTVEISVQNNNHPNFQDREGNGSDNDNVALRGHRFGEAGNTNDAAWGGFASSCWLPAKNFINAAGDALPATPVLGDMWHLSESGDYIQFVPRRYFR